MLFMLIDRTCKHVSYFDHKPSCWSPDNTIMRQDNSKWQLLQKFDWGWVIIAGGF